MSKKHTAARTAALAAATLLMSAGTMGPALADHDHGQGKSQDPGSSQAADHRQNGADHGPSAPAGHNAQRGDAAKAHQGSHGDQAEHSDAAKTAGNNGQGAERGNGHTPVTVCHVLGNGGYHLLTMDDNALDAHLNHGDLYPAPAEGCPAAEAPGEDVSEDGAPAKPDHERVTVCHLLGNGGYHLLTFDSHALKAHLAHGDSLTIPSTGCASPSATDEAPETIVPESGETAILPENDLVKTDFTTTTTTIAPQQDSAVVAGVEAFAPQTGTTKTSTGTVLGAQATRTVNSSAPVTGALAGILPQTGAGQLGLSLLAGLILLAGGATLVARRRSQGVL